MDNELGEEVAGDEPSPPKNAKKNGSRLYTVPAKTPGSGLRILSTAAPVSLIRLNVAVPNRNATPAQRSVRLRQTRPIQSKKTPAVGNKIKVRVRPAKALSKKSPSAVKAAARAAVAAHGKGDRSAAGKPMRGRFLTPRYRLLRLLGEGGSGTVYKAEDTLLNAIVAVKVLNQDLTFDKAAVESLKAEALTAMRLSHPHIVHLNNLDKAGVRFFLIMEYIEGNTLRGLLDLYGRLKMDSVARILTVCADALSYAHRTGVLHNDLKPANLVITEDGIVKVIDFGISCLIHTQQKDFIMGTPAYMSPEQIRGETLDQRTDIYSLAVMAYEMLIGKTPFPKTAQFQDVLDMLPVPLAEIEDAGVRRVLEKAMAPDREVRYDSVSSFTTAFIEAAYPKLENGMGISV